MFWSDECVGEGLATYMAGCLGNDWRWVILGMAVEAAGAI